MSTESSCPHCGAEKLATTARCNQCGQDAFEPKLYESIAFPKEPTAPKFDSSNPIKDFFAFLKRLFFRPELVFEDVRTNVYKPAMVVTYSLIISWAVSIFESMFYRSMHDRIEAFMKSRLFEDDETVSLLNQWLTPNKQESIGQLFSSWHLYVGRALLDPFFTIVKFGFMSGIFWLFIWLLSPSTKRSNVDYFKVLSIVAIADCARVFQLMPFLGWLVSLLAVVYLQITGIRTVFSMSGTRATLVLMLPPMILLGFFAFIALFFTVGIMALFSSFFGS